MKKEYKEDIMGECVARWTIIPTIMISQYDDDGICCSCGSNLVLDLES